MASIEFNYEGRDITIQCNNYDTLDKIIQQYLNKSQVDPNSVSFLYNGDLITNKNLRFNELSNSYDKSRNKMNVLVQILYLNRHYNLKLKFLLEQMNQ